MTPTELANCLNKIISVHNPRSLASFYDPNHRNNITLAWAEAFQDLDEKSLLLAIKHITENISPREYQGYGVKEYKDLATKIQNHKQIKSANRRIKTAEEDIADLYDELIQALGKVKDPDRREEIRAQAERIKPYWDLFNGEGWLERYQHYFNTTKTREEYEKL